MSIAEKDTVQLVKIIASGPRELGGADSPCIGKGKKVTLHFSLSLLDGSIFDSNFDKKPVTFTVGDGNLLEGFEQALFGLTAGQKKKLIISSENGFGEPNPDNIQEYDKTRFSQDTTLEEGVVISFSGLGDYQQAGVVREIKKETVIVDFNHPLAGKDIEFDVKVISVEAVESKI